MRWRGIGEGLGGWARAQRVEEKGVEVEDGDGGVEEVGQRVRVVGGEGEDGRFAVRSGTEGPPPRRPAPLGLVADGVYGRPHPAEVRGRERDADAVEAEGEAVATRAPHDGAPGAEGDPGIAEGGAGGHGALFRSDPNLDSV